jgi:hypothetical protein
VCWLLVAVCCALFWDMCYAVCWGAFVVVVAHAQFDYSDNCFKSISHVDAGNLTRTGNI